jgi:hypothetical protein
MKGALLVFVTLLNVLVLLLLTDEFGTLAKLIKMLLAISLVI